MRVNLTHDDLIMERGGNLGNTGVATNPDGYPLKKIYFGTTHSRRCKDIIRVRQEISMAEASEALPMREREVVRARIQGEIL
ncbi:MAG: hypothetical protein ABSE05_06370 [Syntrophales bacterium]|jgi:hypothetical protein